MVYLSKILLSTTSLIGQNYIFTAFTSFRLFIYLNKCTNPLRFNKQDLDNILEIPNQDAWKHICNPFGDEKLDN